MLAPQIVHEFGLLINIGFMEIQKLNVVKVWMTV